MPREKSDKTETGAESVLPATTYAVLGLLSFGEELSGYDLKKWADWTIRFFYWSPSFSQIYSQLRRLETLGYVSSRLAQSSSVRERRLYAITDEGISVMRDWADTAPLGLSVLKHALVLRVWLGHLTDPQRLELLLIQHRDQVLEMAQRAKTHGEGAVRGDWAYPEIALKWSQRYYESEAVLAEGMLADLQELKRDGIGQTGKFDASAAP